MERWDSNPLHGCLARAGQVVQATVAPLAPSQTPYRFPDNEQRPGSQLRPVQVASYAFNEQMNISGAKSPVSCRLHSFSPPTWQPFVALFGEADRVSPPPKSCREGGFLATPSIIVCRRVRRCDCWTVGWASSPTIHLLRRASRR